MAVTTEIVTMKTIPGITKNEFIQIVTGLEREFHSKQEGFLDTELLFDEGNGEWLMVQHWKTAELLKTASRNLFKDKGAEMFVKALDPKTVKMKILPQIGTWR